ncbi:MAG: hypothetical protein VB108_01150 [Anaerolineaceae bacterium]|nr:hypothetical protein [Anaerolineaceae bacterium]
MSILEAVRDHLRLYQPLQNIDLFQIDKLQPDPVSYSIYSTPTQKVLQSYIGGGGMFQLQFIVRCTASMASEDTRIEANEFFDAFSDWLAEQNLKRNLPDLGIGKTAYSIETSSAGYLIQEGESGTGIYEMPCNLIYESEK